MTARPKLSIVVIFFNMRREAARTLYTLSADYQQDVRLEDYEIIAIDNGSTDPLEPESVREIGANFVYHFLDTESASPVGAVNLGARMAKGEFLAIIVDGARMVTPRLISQTLHAFSLSREALICCLAWHLGPDVQRKAISRGYCREEEDRLLEAIDWRNNGYGLFEIASLAPSSEIGFFGGMPSECSWIAIQKTTFEEIGEYDERFQSPGGGLVNQDFLKRVLARPGIKPIVLLGEGSFHQIHGGVATNSKAGEHPLVQFKREYRAIRGREYIPISQVQPAYFGKVRENAKRFENGHLRNEPLSIGRRTYDFLSISASKIRNSIFG